MLTAIAAEFGDGMLRADGSLDRAGARRSRVRRPRRGDAPQRDRASGGAHRVASAGSRRHSTADPNAVVVYDVPLLAEARLGDPWDLIVVAHAPAELRIQRLVELRGLSEADAAARIASQVSDETRLGIADVVIETAGSLEDTLRQTDRLWARSAAAASQRQARRLGVN